MPSFSATYREVIVGPGIVPVLLLPGNQLRLSIAMNGTGFGDFGVGVETNVNPILQQFLVRAGDNFFVKYANHGPLIQMPWFCTRAGAVGIICITEIFTVPGSF